MRITQSWQLVSCLFAGLGQVRVARGYALQDIVSSVHGSRGAVASESDICSRIGIDLIEHGGNAADAMVGTTLCVGVIGMYHSGIGGGGLMLVRDKDGKYESIDYRESAPAAAHRDMYRGNVNGSVFGGLAVGVPGELRGLQYLHDKYGALPWRAVVKPAVRVARNGFNVTEDLVRYMQFAQEYAGNFLVDDPIWAEDFAPNGKLVELGDVITRKRYADTLEKIGREGADAFYKGEIAESMIKLIQETNGTMTMDDLRNYRAVSRRALSVDFRGYKIFATGAPASGAVTLATLKTMEQYAIEDGLDTNLTTHRFVEAMRFAYGARTELGDPDFVTNATLFEDLLLSKHKARDTAQHILDDRTQPVEAYDPHLEDGDDADDGPSRQQYYAPPGHGTSHIVTADASGLTVSSTTTINLLFGAVIMTPDTGIILNNEMNDFSIPGARNEFGFEPSPANYAAPGKRPLSSVTPAMAELAGNGTLLLATGAAGGSRIISATALALWNVLERGQPLREAVAAPRLHDQLMPNEAWFEWTYDNGTVADMRARGHNVKWVRLGISAVQGIRRLWDGSFEAVGETRQKNSGGLSI
ncbi:uncharacterized protein E0L32_007351 [Thyridium curvatum]|uniref:Glutathione hydrolase n=1 Tax=Thyridium curvatum TaxID=1093900 RepID=A0A507AVV6_9PEZI|nr:uncharacterized protein E0L32_007351 [Thyridium curvatum]TPX11853.1 hypothetical protein E0L32_007351 [Thyridium curvatum]